MQNKESRKSQVSTDLFIAMFVFIIILITVFYTWNLYASRLNEKLFYDEMIVNAYQISDLLVKTSGYPPDWEYNNLNVETIGFSKYDRILNNKKIEAFTNLTYNNSKELMNIERYEFYFRVKSFNGTIDKEYGKNFTGQNSVNIKRMVYVENEAKILEFMLWK